MAKETAVTRENDCYAGAPASLCLFRLSAIGDVTHLLPVLRTVQRHWPQTAITWVIGRLEAGLVGDIPGVDFRVLDKNDGIRACRKQLRAAEGGRVHDLILQMQASLRASLIATGLQGRRRIGFDRTRAVNGQWLFTNERIAARPRQHVLDGFFGFLAQAGLPTRELVWDIPLPEAAKEFAGRHLPHERPLLAISPCSSQRWRNYRDWPVERYIEVAKHAGKRGLRVVLLGGSSARERAYAEAIGAGAGEPPIDLVGRTSLKELAAVLDRCVGLVGPDSGPVHIGSALDRPVIGLYATSNPWRTGPYRHREFVVNRYPEAVRRLLGREVEEVRWGTRVRDPRAMELITAVEVCERIDQLPLDADNLRHC
ncbi:MAG: glycosyltransferase family 9 protein [Desulfurivibrio sp.]|nr:glycosyltransferase family 9 protein [Desulfurivibrio sp.]